MCVVKHYLKQVSSINWFLSYICHTRSSLCLRCESLFTYLPDLRVFSLYFIQRSDPKITCNSMKDTKIKSFADYSAIEMLNHIIWLKLTFKDLE